MIIKKIVYTENETMNGGEKHKQSKRKLISSHSPSLSLFLFLVKLVSVTLHCKRYRSVTRTNLTYFSYLHIYEFNVSSSNTDSDDKKLLQLYGVVCPDIYIYTHAVHSTQ